MNTTTIRIEDELKTRVASLAEQAGKTAHAFILEAIAAKVEQGESDAEFHRLADARWARLLVTGETVGLEDAKAYLQARTRGAAATRPVARKFGG